MENNQKSHRVEGFFTEKEIQKLNLLSVPFSALKHQLDKVVYVSDIAYNPAKEIVYINDFFLIGRTKDYPVEISSPGAVNEVTKIETVICSAQHLSNVQLAVFSDQEFELVSSITLEMPLYSFGQITRVCAESGLALPTPPEDGLLSHDESKGVYFPISTARLRAAADAQKEFWSSVEDERDPPLQKTVQFFIHEHLGKTKYEPDRTDKELALAIKPEYILDK